MWEASLLPMLGTTDGRVLFCSTPAGGGNFSASFGNEQSQHQAGHVGLLNQSKVAGLALSLWTKPEYKPFLYRQEFEASIESYLVRFMVISADR